MSGSGYGSSSYRESLAKEEEEKPIGFFGKLFKGGGKKDDTPGAVGGIGRNPDNNRKKSWNTKYEDAADRNPAIPRPRTGSLRVDGQGGSMPPYGGHPGKPPPPPSSSAPQGYDFDFNKPILGGKRESPNSGVAGAARGSPIESNNNNKQSDWYARFEKDKNSHLFAGANIPKSNLNKPVNAAGSIFASQNLGQNLGSGKDNPLSASLGAAKRPICVAYLEGTCEFGAWCFWSHGNDAEAPVIGGQRRSSFSSADKDYCGEVYVPPPTKDPQNRPIFIDKKSSGMPSEYGRPNSKDGGGGARQRSQSVVDPGDRSKPTPGRQSIIGKMFGMFSKKKRDDLLRDTSKSTNHDDYYTYDEDHQDERPPDPDGEGDRLFEYMRQRDKFNMEMTAKASDLKGLFAKMREEGGDDDEDYLSTIESDFEYIPGAGIGAAAKTFDYNPDDDSYPSYEPSGIGQKRSGANVYDNLNVPTAGSQPSSSTKNSDGKKASPTSQASPTQGSPIPTPSPSPAGGSASTATAEGRIPKFDFRKFNPTPTPTTSGSSANVYPGGKAEGPPGPPPGGQQAQTTEEEEAWKRKQAEKNQRRDSNVYNKKVAPEAGEDDKENDKENSGPSTKGGGVPSWRTSGAANREHGDQRERDKQYWEGMGKKEAAKEQEKQREMERQAREKQFKEERERQRQEYQKEAQEKAEKAAEAAREKAERDREKAERGREHKEQRDRERKEQREQRDREREEQRKEEQKKKEKETKRETKSEKKKSKHPKSGYFWHEGYYYYYDGKYDVYWWYCEEQKKYYQCRKETEEDKKERKEGSNKNDQKEKRCNPDFDVTNTAKAFMKTTSEANAEQVEVNNTIIKLVKKLKDAESLSLPDRKKLYKKLCLEWHPDKHAEEKRFLATCAFQFLQEKKEWFLKP